MVGKRPVDELPHGDAGEIERERELDGGDVGREEADQARHRRDEDVHGDGADGGRQDQDEERRSPAGHGHERGQ